MAIPIDRVYKTVQRVLNVEQRGQLPPEDFNYFAHLAQLDVFNRLFYDEPHFQISQKGTASVKNALKEMQDVFYERRVITTRGTSNVGERFSLDFGSEDSETEGALYRLENVFYENTAGELVKVEKINKNELGYVLRSCLTQPTLQFPKYVRYHNELGSSRGNLVIYPQSISSITVEYIRQPVNPNWAYVSVAGVPVYNDGNSQDFDLHPMMENDLIIRILFYAGVSIRQEEISSLFASLEAKEEQSEKS